MVAASPLLHLVYPWQGARPSDTRAFLCLKFNLCKIRNTSESLSIAVQPGSTKAFTAENNGFGFVWKSSTGGKSVSFPSPPNRQRLMNFGQRFSGNAQNDTKTSAPLGTITKDTYLAMPQRRIEPFSNGTEEMVWQEHNCDHCTNRKQCTAGRNIDAGFIFGDIPIRSARFIGMKNDRELLWDCSKRNQRAFQMRKRTVRYKPNQLMFDL